MIYHLLHPPSTKDIPIVFIGIDNAFIPFSVIGKLLVYGIQCLFLFTALKYEGLHTPPFKIYKLSNLSVIFYFLGSHLRHNMSKHGMASSLFRGDLISFVPVFPKVPFYKGFTKKSERIFIFWGDLLVFTIFRAALLMNMKRCRYILIKYEEGINELSGLLYKGDTQQFPQPF